MSARDELASTMRQNFSGWMGPAVSYEVADAILAAGYRKPRTITTAKELDALPDHSVILSRQGYSAQKTVGNWWVAGEHLAVVPELPVTVLHEASA